jgi:septum formation protein
MGTKIILASGSEIRRTLLENAGVDCQIERPMIDESAILSAMLAEGAPPRDIAATLAEQKARKISLKHPDAMVIGCDQILEQDGHLFQKPVDIKDARRQLAALSGKAHRLMSAAVVFQNGAHLWRHVGVVDLQMRAVDAAYQEQYLQRNWDSVRHAVGCYKLEEEGVRLFSRIEGDYFTVLGLPLVELLGYLTLRGVLDG